MNLKEFQEKFQKYIFLDENHSDLNKIIKPGGTIKTNIDALDIHKRGYVVSLSEMLGDEYESCWWVLGDEVFFNLCEKFVLKYPSKTYNLMFYGFEFPNFLNDSGYSEEAPFLFELAKFEQVNTATFHMKQHETYSQEQLQVIFQDPDQNMKFAESTQVFTSDYSVYSLWMHVKKNSDQEDFEFDINESEQVLFYKTNDQVYCRALSVKEAQLLKALLNSKSINSFIESIEIDVSPEDIQGIFAIVAESGILVNNS